MTTTIAKHYVPTYLTQNLKNGQIFSMGLQGQDKRFVGRLVSTEGNTLDVKPMNGVKGQHPINIHVGNVTILKVKGEEVNIFD